MKTLPRTLVPLCLACLSLVGCGGGGGGMVRSDPPPPPPAPPPPAPPPGGAPAEPCRAPVTGDCTVELPSTPTWDEIALTGGRQSDFKLFVHGEGGYLSLKDGEYRFSAGTTIAGATLVVWDTLVSNVAIAHDFTGLGFFGTSQLWLTGTVRGDVHNEEVVSLRHKCGTGLNVCTEDRRSRIEGNYLQGSTGTLEAVLGWDLQVTGSAALDGNLRLIRGTSRSYVLPSPSSVLVLHADRGVTGRFIDWSAQGLFLEGGLRYTANDVYFDATRISVAAAMATAGAPASTLAGAAHLDRAFAGADRYAGSPPASLATVQRAFLASAASVQHIGDIGQATRTIDSLSGSSHAQVGEVLRQQAYASAVRLSEHASAAPASITRAWSASQGHNGLGGQHAMTDTVIGTDHWLNARWLLGGSAADGSTSMQFDHGDGRGFGRVPAASVYAHYRGDGWVATGVIGARRADLWLDRPLRLGAAGDHVARSRRTTSHTFVHAEGGRPLRLGAGTLTPLAALDYAAIRDDGFNEQGDTGFELMVGSSRRRDLAASFGARYARDWNFGRDRWLQLRADARMQRWLGATGDAARAAFVGVPDVRFDLPLGRAMEGGWLDLEVSGGLGPAWGWSMTYARPFAGMPGYPGWELGLQRRF